MDSKSERAFAHQPDAEPFASWMSVSVISSEIRCPEVPCRWMIGLARRVEIYCFRQTVSFASHGMAIAKRLFIIDNWTRAHCWRHFIWNALKPMRIAYTTFLLLSVGLPLSSSAADSPTLLQSAFKAHCVKCHGKGRKIQGQVDLLALRSGDDLEANPELLERLVEVLVDRRMPPEDEPALSMVQRGQMVSSLQAMLERTLKTQPFGPTPIRRMNRLQYNNAVVDLLELDRDIFQLNERLMRRRDDYFRPESRRMPAEVRVSSRPLSKDIDNQRPEGFKGVAAFPQDQRAEHGFDNRADHLTLSPLLMESLLQLSQTIVESPDLNAKECRSWDWLFASPGKPDESANSTRAAPAGTVAAESIRPRIAKLLRRAFRRPADSETLDRFTQFAGEQLAAGDSFRDTMRTIVGAVLSTPDFLYFYESPARESPADENPGRQRVDDFELASRLALFFWSSIPDDTLLDLAESGKLSDPEVLGTQIDRMLNDRRSSRFCDNFPAQWLQLERLITATPDPQRFPYFYYNGYRTSMHMMSEPLLLFETIYIEDRSIMELIDPKFTWRSDMLRANYEGKSHRGRDVQVQVFRRVSLDDPRQGGVITNAAVMTMTSTATRTQPISRGAWVNAVIFNDPPQPPPADVPPLPEDDKEALAKLTIRERLAVHRKRADCAGCHNQIDPLGFALENYGPTGVWRDTYDNGREVDPGGVLFDQHEFKSVVEFKRLILQEKQRFIRGFVAHLLSYALARKLGPADSPALDDITAKAVAGEDQMRVVLRNVAMSEPFLHKSVQGFVPEK